MAGSPEHLRALLGRFDHEVMDVPRGKARVRLEVRGHGRWDALIERKQARLATANGEKPDAVLSADPATWQAISKDIRGGMQAYRQGRLSIRHNMHLGVGLLAATSGNKAKSRLEFKRTKTRAGTFSYIQAGQGEPVLLLHGLGGTKASFLPTVSALAEHHTLIAPDHLGFGESDKPIGAPYDARFFAKSITALMDELDIDSAHVVGNSMGGRVALELGLTYPDRTNKLVLLSPSLAWLKERKWIGALRVVRPELGLLQVAPRPAVEAVVRRLVPGGMDGWAAVGLDEFLRAYCTPRGRAAFYAAARQIYLEEPHGENGFWTRLQDLQPESLFVWGTQDKLVPIAFAGHVAKALPRAKHLEQNCGHVPQIERPDETHRAIRQFLARREAKSA
jgi:pimeloyl-ACP methyl ester carboxylesterase